MPWYVAALGAAVVWGLHYPLLDHALKKISLTSALLLTALPIFFVALLNFKQVVSDFAVVRQLAPSTQLMRRCGVGQQAWRNFLSRSVRRRAASRLRRMRQVQGAPPPGRGV